MKIGIICAIDRELAPFLPAIKDVKESEKAMLKLYEGTIYDVEIVAVACGMGKVNAAIAAQLIIDSFNADAIISSGTAGAIDKSLNIFDTVVATKAAYHDVKSTVLTSNHPFMEDIYFPSDCKLIDAARNSAHNLQRAESVKFGEIVSGESFIEGAEKARISALFEPLAVDMETAAIAHVCYANKIPFISVRTITDMADENASDSISANAEKAILLSAQLCADIIRQTSKFRKIREVEIRDIKECASVIKESFDEVSLKLGITRENAPRYTPFVTDEERLAHNFYATQKYVCCENDRIIGYYSLSILGNGECELNNLCVLPGHRHDGVGTMLLNHAEETARDSECAVINVGIVEENKILRAWLEKNGFIHIAENKFEYFPFTSGFMKKFL